MSRAAGTNIGPIARISQVRETKKAAKRQRIAMAAYELFSERGYDGTTMRDIAQYAGVALGTLSLYASDKRDLVLLIFNERIPQLSDAAERLASREAELIEKLLAYFRVLNQHFVANIGISRIHLQLNYYSRSMHSAEYDKNRQRLFNFVQDCVREAQQAGKISAGEDPALAARHLFFVYSASLRWWLASERPELETSMKELRPLFELLLRGLAPRETKGRSRGAPISSRRTPAANKSPARPHRASRPKRAAVGD